MTTSESNIEEYGKAHVDCAEDLERVSTTKPIDVAHMERIELTKEDVRVSFFE